MAIPDSYSIRNNPQPDVFIYDTLPLKLKNQVVHIWTRFFNKINKDTVEDIWEILEKQIAEQHGLKTLLEEYLVRYNERYKVEHYFLDNNAIDECLDIIEFVFRIIIKAGERFNLVLDTEDAIKDLNKRFLISGVGFQLIQNNFIKVDNALLHKEIIKPSLQLLNDKAYENANEEFLKAHEHFRHGRNKDCLNDCLKAFETTMKIICTRNKWVFDERDAANKLINILKTNNFFPNYHETQLNAIKQVLESGAPTIRNKNGAHGQGVNKILVDDNLSSYMLNITGATIKFLINLDSAS